MTSAKRYSSRQLAGFPSRPEKWEQQIVNLHMQGTPPQVHLCVNQHLERILTCSPRLLIVVLQGPVATQQFISHPSQPSFGPAKQKASPTTASSVERHFVLCQCLVDHKADIDLVDAHAEGNCCHNDLQFSCANKCPPNGMISSCTGAMQTCCQSFGMHV